MFEFPETFRGEEIAPGHGHDKRAYARMTALVVVGACARRNDRRVAGRNQRQVGEAITLIERKPFARDEARAAVIIVQLAVRAELGALGRAYCTTSSGWKRMTMVS